MQYLFIYTMCIYLITQNIFQAHILTYSNYYVQISLKQYSLKMYFVAPQIPGTNAQYSNLCPALVIIYS